MAGLYKQQIFMTLQGSYENLDVSQISGRVFAKLVTYYCYHVYIVIEVVRWNVLFIGIASVCDGVQREISSDTDQRADWQNEKKER